MSSFTEWLKSVGLAGYPQTQPYGANPGRYGYGAAGHGAVDIGTPVGTPLRVPAGVTKITAIQERDKNGNLSGWGNYLRMFYADGSWSQFAHLSGFVGIKPGQTISNPLPGQVYAKSGNTGNSTGPHVDIERRTASGQRVNPATAAYNSVVARLAPGKPTAALPTLTGGVALPGLNDPAPAVPGSGETVWAKLTRLGVDFSKWNQQMKDSFEKSYDPATGKFKTLPIDWEKLTPDVLKAFTGIDNTQPNWEATPEAQQYAGQGMAGQITGFLTSAGYSVLGVLLALVLLIGGVYLLGASF